MSDVGASLRLFGSSQAGVGAAGNTGRVVNPPPSLLQLGGEAMPGTVVGRDAQGKLLVKGDFGQIAVATSARFAAGMAVSLHFRPHVSGLFVTVVPRALPAGAPTAGLPQAAAGGLAAAAAQSSPASAAPGTPTGAPPAAPAKAPAGTPSGAPHAAVAGRATPPSATPTAAAVPLPGLVVGRNAQDHLLIRLGAGQVAVATPARVVAGTSVLLQVADGSAGRVATLFAAPAVTAGEAGPPPGLRAIAFGPVIGGSPFGEAPAAARPAAPLGAPAPLARVWPTLTAFVEAFGEPQALGLASLLPPGFPPKAGPHLALSLLRFLQACQGQGLLDWIGPQAPAGLAANRQGPPAERLLEADDELRWLAKDPPGDWRLVLLPLVGEGRVDALRLFLKKRGPQEEDEAAPPTHFLCDLALSRLGALQIEGLLRAQRFDLALRSRRELAPALRTEIGEIFRLASEAGGLAGALRFQAGDDWQPLPVPRPAGPQAAVTA